MVVVAKRPMSRMLLLAVGCLLACAAPRPSRRPSGGRTAAASQPAQKDARLKEAVDLLKQAEQALADGQYNQGVPLSEQALKLREEALGQQHPDVAEALNDLAILYTRLGEYKQARSVQLRALQIREKAFGPHHPADAQSLNNMDWPSRTFCAPCRSEKRRCRPCTATWLNR
jgi:tetratricopeptide (TPR) repeat protein